MAVKKTSAKEKSVSVEAFLGEVKDTAFQIYQERVKKNQPGDEMSDWLDAEKLVKKKYSL